MTGLALYRRLHFYAGNCARYLSRSWKEFQISPEEATTLFGASYGAKGWNHLRRTLAEYDNNPAINYRDTSLYKFLTKFKPSSTCRWAQVPCHEHCDLPVFVYPWGTFKKGEIVSRKVPANSRFCGPSSDEFVAQEFLRTIQLYRKIKRDGYKPWNYGNTFIGGTMLVNRGGERRFVVLQGNHRLAILAHLGHRAIQVRDCRGYHPNVFEKDVHDWPLVRQGACSARAALSIFEFFFQSDGSHLESITRAN